MEEKRHSRRLPIELKLEISSLFKQDNVKVNNLHAPIEVIDISRDGLGFVSEAILPVGFYFNATLQLGDENAKLYTVINIIRIKPNYKGKDVTLYGCEFVGMAPVLSYIFDEYEERLIEDGVVDPLKK